MYPKEYTCTRKQIVDTTASIRRLNGSMRNPTRILMSPTATQVAAYSIGLGVEKVALSAAAVADPTLVSRIAEEIGRQSVVAVLDVKRPGSAGEYAVWTHNGSKPTGREALDLARELEQAGAGEIVVNSIDRDGTMGGYDLELAAKVRNALGIPVTILGGAGSLADIKALVDRCGIVGAAAGSLFVFKGPYRAVLINYPNPGQKEALVQAR